MKVNNNYTFADAIGEYELWDSEYVCFYVQQRCLNKSHHKLKQKAADVFYGICSFWSFGMWLIKVWLLGLLAGDWYVMCTQTMSSAVCASRTHICIPLWQIFKGRQMKGQRGLQETQHRSVLGQQIQQTCGGKGFLMNLCPNTFLPERRAV